MGCVYRHSADISKFGSLWKAQAEVSLRIIRAAWELSRSWRLVEGKTGKEFEN
jgi:hypothetical protein